MGKMHLPFCMTRKYDLPFSCVTAEEIAQAALEESKDEAAQAVAKAQQAAKAGGAVILTEKGGHLAACPRAVVHQEQLYTRGVTSQPHIVGCIMQGKEAKGTAVVGAGVMPLAWVMAQMERKQRKKAPQQPSQRKPVTLASRRRNRTHWQLSSRKNQWQLSRKKIMVVASRGVAPKRVRQRQCRKSPWLPQQGNQLLQGVQLKQQW